MSGSFDRDFEHRERLIASALREFSERGYQAASLNRMLKDSGVSKGQFYHHFDGKKDLYMGLVGVLIERKRAHFQANPVPDQGDFFSSLAAQLRAGLDFSRAQPDMDAFARSFLRERGQPIFREVLRQHAFGAHGPLGALVDRGLDQGHFHPSLSRAFVHDAVAMVFNQLTELVDGSTPERLEAHVDDLVGFLRRGLGR